MGIQFPIVATISIAIVIISITLIHLSFSRNLAPNKPAKASATLSLLVSQFTLFNLVNEDTGFIYLVPFAIASYFVTYIDIQTRRIPNSINFYLAFAMTIAVLVLGFRDPDCEIFLILIGGISLFTFYFALNLLSGNRIGMGDVKLAYSVGMASGSFGVYGVTLATLVTFTLGGFFALLLLVIKKANLQSEFAFGPFMILGTWLSLLIINTFGQIQ